MNRFVPDNKCIVLDKPTKLFLASIHQMRKEAGLTQRMLAAMLNVHVANVCYIERGVHFPSIRILMKLADIFSVDLSDSINYKLFHNLIKPERLRELFKKFNFNYRELSRLTGYSPRSVKDSMDFNHRATPQCIAAVIDVLEHERAACNFRQKLLVKGRRQKRE